MKEIAAIDAEIVYHVWAVVKPDSKVSCGLVQTVHHKFDPQIDTIHEDKSVCLFFRAASKIECDWIVSELREAGVAASVEPGVREYIRFTDGTDTAIAKSLVNVDPRTTKLFLE